MRKIKIAQIGTSQYSHGNHVFNSLNKQSDIFELAGYAFPENEREKFPDNVVLFNSAKELTVEQILNDPEIEAVTIETEECFLTKYAIMAAEKGKHIHMEKPGGTNLAEFEKLIETVKKTGKTLHMGYMYRYNPCIQELMGKLKRGELGEIFSVEAQMNCRHTEHARKWLGKYKGGMMFYLGCHLVDLVLQIQGKPDKIIPLNKSTGMDGLTSEDYGMAVLEYPNGTSFVKTCACEIGGFVRRQLVVSGTKGTVEFKPLEILIPNTEYSQYTEKTEYMDGEDWHTKGEHSRSEIHDRYDAMLSAFAEMVRGEKTNPYTLDYELDLYKTILKCCDA